MNWTMDAEIEMIREKIAEMDKSDNFDIEEYTRLLETLEELEAGKYSRPYLVQ